MCLSIALLIALSMGVFLSTPAATPSAAQGFPTNTVGPNPTATATPFVANPSATPTLFPTSIFPTATLANCLTPLPFTRGDIIALSGGVNIHSAPSASAPILAYFPERREFTLVEGPVCTGGFNFWRIEGHGVIGWAAEGRLTRYWMRLIVDNEAPQCLTPLPLTVGERFRVVTGVYVRAEPSLSALPVTLVNTDERVIILEGPRCADRYNWWRVRVVVVGVTYEGWMAEADRFGEEFIARPTRDPGTICYYPLPFSIGDRVNVTYDDSIPKRLRTGPDTSAPILYELLKETPMIIIGGPVCADTYNWWQVRVLASTEITGWIAEGGPGSYWLTRDPSLNN